MSAQNSTTPASKLPSSVFQWEKLVPLPTKKGWRRDPFDAPTVTLDRFHCHITTLNPGENTGELHRTPQEELVIVKEGTLEVNINGQMHTATAGSMIFFSSNELENMRNVGTTPATYYVLQIFTALTPKE